METEQDIVRVAFFLAALFALGLFLNTLLHEYIHALVGILFGQKVQQMHFTLFWGEVTFTGQPLPDFRRGLVALAGPVVTLFIGYLLYFLRRAFQKNFFVHAMMVMFTVSAVIASPVYLLLGAVFHAGDPAGITGGLGISYRVILLVSILLLIWGKKLERKMNIELFFYQFTGLKRNLKLTYYLWGVFVAFYAIVGVAFTVFIRGTGP